MRDRADRRLCAAAAGGLQHGSCAQTLQFCAAFWPNGALIANMTVPELRVPPGGAEIERLFAGWREELATRRKFVPAARNYAAARLEAGIGLRVNEIRMLDLDDVRWELGRFGKLNVRHGKGARRRVPSRGWGR